VATMGKTRKMRRLLLRRIAVPIPNQVELCNTEQTPDNRSATMASQTATVGLARESLPLWNIPDTSGSETT
jgi:hypothetical protein